MRHGSLIRTCVLSLAWPAFVALANLPLPSRAAAPVPEASDQVKDKPATSGPTADALRALEFRNIGPAIMGGRIDDIAVVELNPSVFYVATASGGLWKTLNNGVTFHPVFDDQETSSIGDVAVAPSNPNIVYVGTGEPNNRQSSSWGTGVYKSLDGGRTWISLGLADTLHVGRVVVHPTDPDIVYVAALGHLWGPSKARGLYKSTDGGRNWTNTKFIDDDTGFVDVVLDELHPNTLYAASYQRRRTPFGFNGGGPGGALWKTVDGGQTWRKLASGLPKDGDIGRIGVTIYRRDPRLIYALVEHATEGGLYRSDDAGETWRKVSSTNPRPSYYSKIHVDPNNDQRVWILGALMYYSEDGGKTFRTDWVQRIHSDHHALWINPANSDHMLAGSDGGIHISYDRGRSWNFLNTLPLGQFYEVHYDMRNPYHVCGGLQDNGSWCGPGRTTYTQGISNEDWYRVGGGDGFYNVIDPTDHNIIYTESQDGNIQRFDLRTTERRVIRPIPPPGEEYRFNWNSPILVSPHDPKAVYYGGNRLFGSRDRGDTWTLVSPDLTTAPDRDTMKIFGRTATDFLSRNDGVRWFGTITTIAESPLKPGILWVGTDDGNLQVSRDGGRNWANVAARVPGLPKGTYVSRVEASHSGEGAAYAAFDGHRSDDYAPYVFRTDDFGQTWQNVSSSLPRGGTVSVIREHPTNTDLLFAGTERALWVSWNRGREWHQVKNLPTVPVDDIQIHPRDNDLILGTHGRSIFILDDITPLAQLAEAATSDGAQAGEVGLYLFDVRPPIQYRIYNHKGDTGHEFFTTPNPPEGALITYFLKTEAKKARARITITDASGKAVRELEGPTEAGLNRASWDLRHEPPLPPDPAAPSFVQARGPRVPPGQYAIKVSVGTASATKNVAVREDPRIQISDADRKAWADAMDAAGRLLKRVDAANQSAGSVKRQLGEVQESLQRRDPRPPDTVTGAVKKLLDGVNALARRLTRETPMGFAGAPLASEPDPLVSRVRSLYAALSSITAPPTLPQQELLGRLTQEVDEVGGAIDAVRERDVPVLNRLLLEHGVGRIQD